MAQSTTGQAGPAAANGARADAPGGARPRRDDVAAVPDHGAAGRDEDGAAGRDEDGAAGWDEGGAAGRDEGGAAGRDERAVGRFVENLASALTEMGVPRMPARVFAALLATDSGRLTAAELAAGLQVSPAAVSGAVRYLIQIGMARRESEPGSRRHYYRAPNDVWDEVIGIRDRMMARWTGVLREGVEVLGPDTPAGERVAESVRFFEFVSSELPSVIGRWRERRPARHEDAAGGG
jgi:predicted transcriptional regulator